MSSFQRAVRHTAKIRLALTGPSGSGKTWTALAIASGLGQRIALIDTERGGGSFYADQFTFDTLELVSFHPEQYIKALQAAADEHYEVVIVDSLSHAWFGKDGALELVDRAAKASKSGNSFTAWREVTPVHNKLVDALVQTPMHVIVTLRSKTEYVLESDGRGKQVPRKVGMAPVQRDGLEYEFDVVADLDHQHTLVVTKSRIVGLADLVLERPGREFGVRIATALTTSEPQTASSPPTGEFYDDAHPAVERINVLLTRLGQDDGARGRWWAKVDQRYPRRDAFILTKLYDELREQAAKRRIDLGDGATVNVTTGEVVDVAHREEFYTEEEVS